MKRISAVLLIIGMAFIAFALKRDPAYQLARLKGADAKIELHVIDDESNVVANTCVQVFMGMNFRPEGYWIKGYTSTNGIFLIKGKTCGDEVEILLSKGGYYSSSKKLCFAAMGAELDVKDGKWQPYGGRKDIELRKIRKPVKLMCETLFIDIAETNRWIGFDMSAKDFVHPWGKGVTADLEIRSEWDGKAPIGSKMCYGELRFTQPFAGGYYAKKIVESSYPYVYGARRDDGYAVSGVKVVNRMGSPGFTKVPFREDSVLVTRTRCVIDVATGKLESANYGYIKDFMISPSWKGKCTLRLFYIFNPTPNDTNLEHR